MTSVLARRDRALTPEETEALLRDRLGDGIIGSTLEHRTFTVHIAPAAWAETMRRCRDEPLLDFDLFDTLHGVDARDEGFDIVCVLYSTSTGNRLVLRTRCEGGREKPVCQTVTNVYRGADWMERETWDMFGIEFDGHPGLEPRILTVENFEGWPLRKDFHLASRVAKPWPGVKEPAELDEDGNVIERVPGLGDAPGPYVLDDAMAAQAIERRRLAGDPAIVGTPADAPHEDAVAAAAGNEGAVAGDTPVVAAGTGASDAPATTDPVAAADAARTADAARRDAAEARARKAAERAADTEDTTGTADAADTEEQA